MEDGAQGGLPNSDEVLICTSETTSEEVNKTLPMKGITFVSPIRRGRLVGYVVASDLPFLLSPKRTLKSCFFFFLLFYF